MTDDEQPSPWAKIFGPCYTSASVARALRWTPQQVTSAVKSLSLLELETSDGVCLHPAFQIADGRIVDGVGDVLRTLATATTSRWTWAQWLNSRVDDETGQPAPSAIEQLRAGFLDDVLLDARHTAAAWSS